jgi:hypothetical protein
VKKGAEEVAAAVEEVVKPHGFEFGGPYAHLTKPLTCHLTDIFAALV